MPVFSNGSVSVLYVNVPGSGGERVENFFMRNGMRRLLHDGGGTNTLLPVLRCSPQNYHAELLQGVLDLERFAYILMTVRHPVDRAVAEYKAQRRRMRNLLSMKEWLRETLTAFAADPFILDNHIRPQFEFIVPGSDVHEGGSIPDDDWVVRLASRLGVAFADQSIPEEAVSLDDEPDVDVHLGADEITMLEDFYARDFDTFGFERRGHLLRPRIHRSTSPLQATDIVDEEELPLVETLGQLLSPGLAAGRFVLAAPETRTSIGSGPVAYGGDEAPSWFEADAQQYRHGFSLYKLRDAVVFPRAGVVVAPDGRVMKRSFGEAAYLFGSPSQLIADALQSDGTMADAVSVDVLDDQVIIAMPWGGLTNYGHFLFDCLPTLAVCRSFSELDSWVRLFPPLTKWHQTHLELLGMEDVTIMEAPAYRVPDVVWSNAIDHFLHWPNTALLLLRDMQLTLGARQLGTLRQTDKRIWISRAGDVHRRFHATAELEAALRQRGFDIVQPERLSVLDQVRLFSGASVVAGFTGAGFANVLYAPVGTTVVEIIPAPMRSVWVRSLSALVGTNWLPFFCSSHTDEPPTVGGKLRPELSLEVDMSVDSFIAFLDKHLPAAP